MKPSDHIGKITYVELQALVRQMFLEEQERQNRIVRDAMGRSLEKQDTYTITTRTPENGWRLVNNPKG